VFKKNNQSKPKSNLQNPKFNPKFKTKSKPSARNSNPYKITYLPARMQTRKLAESLQQQTKKD
jgi:ribosomal protein S30